MKTIIIKLIFILCFVTNNMNADNGFRGVNFSIPTPNAQDMCRYGTIPMNYYTGRANVSVPIYSTEQGGVPLQISLSYDTGGINMNKVPGWVGENWSLNVGGCITRTICGGEDDDIDHIVQTDTGDANYFDRNEKWEDSINNSDYYTITHNILDYAPDIFTFSFMGKSGRFFLGADKIWKVQSDDNIKIEFDYTNEDNYIYPFIQKSYNSSNDAHRTIKGFTLIDDDGIRYVFGGTTDAIEYSIPLLGMNATIREPWQADSWYLTEVQDRFGNVLYKFNYQRGKFAAQVAYNELTIGQKASYDDGWNNSSYIQTLADTRKFPYSITINAPVFIKEIEIVDKTRINFSLSKDVTRSPKDDFLRSLNHYCQREIHDGFAEKKYSEETYLETLAGRGDQGICFYYLQRMDTAITRYWSDKFLSTLKGNYWSIREPQNTPNPLVVLEYSPLEQICITKGDMVNQTYKLLYDESKRIHLKELHLYGESGLENKYTFDYMDYDKLENIDYMTDSIDYWGYYNANANSYDADTIVSKYGMLSKITYPTGGSTTFEYEQNDYSSYQNTARTFMVNQLGMCGGIRIKSITDYDSQDTKVQKRSFDYYKPGTSISSGQCFSLPCKQSNFTLSDENCTCHLSMTSKVSIIPMMNSFGPHIGYSWVTETYDNGTSNVYHFTNISDYNDEQSIYASTDSVNPYEKFSELGFTRGKLLEQITYDKSWRKVRSIQNEYKTDYKKHYAYAVSKNVFSMIAMANTAKNFVLSYIYKLFYSNFSIAKTTETQYFDRDSIKDISSYEYDDYNCGGTIVRKICSKNVERLLGNNTSINTKESYTYPWNNLTFDGSFYFPVISETSSRNNNIIQISNNSYKTYTIRNKTFPVLDCQNVQIGNGPQKKVVEYISYDGKGQLLKYRELGQPLTRLFWGDTVFNRLEAIVKGNENMDNVCISASEGPMLNGTSLFGNSDFKVEWYKYNNAGLLEGKTLMNGYTEKYEYDAFGRLIGVYEVIRDADVISPWDSNCTVNALRRYSYKYVSGKSITDQTTTSENEQSVTLSVNTYMENSCSGERHVPTSTTDGSVQEEKHSLYNAAETVFNVEKTGNYALGCTSSDIDFSKLYMFIKPTFDVSKEYPYNGNDHVYGSCSVVLKVDGEKVAVTSAIPQYMEWDVVSSAPQRIDFSGTGKLMSYTTKHLTAGKHTMTLELEYSLTPGSAERMNNGWPENENLYKLYGNITEDSEPCCWNLGNINCTLTYTPIE